MHEQDKWINFKLKNILRIGFVSIYYICVVCHSFRVCFEKAVLTYCNKAVVHASENMWNLDAHNATNAMACSTKCKIFPVPKYNAMKAYGGMHMDRVWLISLFCPGTHWMVDITLLPIDLWVKILWHSFDWGDWRYGHFKERNSPPSASKGWSCPQIQPVCRGREKKFRHRGIFSLLR